MLRIEMTAVIRVISTYHPLVKLVVSPAQSVTVNIVLAQSGVGVVNTRGPVEPEKVVNICQIEERE